jgi:hypothetical protein
MRPAGLPHFKRSHYRTFGQVLAIFHPTGRPFRISQWPVLEIDPICHLYGV